MKRTFAIGFSVALSGLAQSQFSPPDTGFARSASGQFVVHGLPQGALSHVPPRFATNVDYVELEPARLTVSSERIKQALFHELRDSSPWRGKIHLHVQFAHDRNDPITIVSERFRNGWNYRVALPQFVERQRLIRALVQSLLMELVNRKARDRAAEIPIWLSEGLTEQLLVMPDIELIPPDTRWSPDGQAIGPTVFDIRRVDSRKPERDSLLATPTANGSRVIWVDPLEAARRTLRERPPLTLEELSWPTDEKLAGEAGEAYRHSAQLFVTELLRLPDGRECLRAMLDELAGCYNWQTAFFRAFQTHFARQLDLEKWWSLQVVNFTGRDPSRLWTVEESWRELDQIVRTPVEIRHAASELPARADVPLQTIVLEWDQVQQTPVLQTKLRNLELMRLRAAPEFVKLIEDYRKVLGSYLRRRDQVGLILTSTTRDTNAKLKIVMRETVKELDALDIRRASLKPAKDSSSPGLVQGKPSPAP